MDAFGDAVRDVCTARTAWSTITTACDAWAVFRARMLDACMSTWFCPRDSCAESKKDEDAAFDPEAQMLLMGGQRIDDEDGFFVYIE